MGGDGWPSTAARQVRSLEGMNAKALVSAILIGSIAVAVAVAFADSSIVVLALPELFSDLDATIPGVSFVVTAYNIVVAVGAFLVLPIARRVSPRLLAQTGLVAFLAASIGAAAADSLTTLVAAPVIRAQENHLASSSEATMTMRHTNSSARTASPPGTTWNSPGPSPTSWG